MLAYGYCSGFNMICLCIDKYYEHTYIYTSTHCTDVRTYQRTTQVTVGLKTIFLIEMNRRRGRNRSQKKVYQSVGETRMSARVMRQKSILLDVINKHSYFFFRCVRYCFIRQCVWTHFIFYRHARLTIEFLFRNYQHLIDVYNTHIYIHWNSIVYIFNNEMILMHTYMEMT